jgi:L,D-transpeptidase YbiS
MQGEARFESGDYEGARKLYQQVMEEYPTSGWADKAQFRTGQCYFKMDQPDEALEEFRRFVDNQHDNSDLTAAQDYMIRILEKKYNDAESNYRTMLAGYEQQNFRLDMMNKYLRRSVDSEVIYIELDLEANRLFVKMGSQTLYEFPMVSGKGRRRLQTTGNLKDFSTPKGVRQVESIIKNPIWYRPDWVWLERGEEVPEELTLEERAVPGILGPYKVSIGNGIYIHGTSRGKIRPGKYSHGCVRMNNEDLRQLVKMVEVGTMVFIY